MACDLVTSEAESQALARILGLSEPDVVGLLNAHLESYGELLITVFLAEVARWRFGDEFSPTVAALVNELLIVGSPAVRNVLLTGFVEGVPQATAVDVVAALAEPLRSEVRRDLGIA